MNDQVQFEQLKAPSDAAFQINIVGLLGSLAGDQDQGAYFGNAVEHLSMKEEAAKLRAENVAMTRQIAEMSHLIDTISGSLAIYRAHQP